MPAAVAEEQDDAGSAEKEVGEGDDVEGAQADRPMCDGEQHMQRREQQRLRVGDLRPAGENIGRPPWPFAARHRARQKLHRRKELRFRIPWNGDGAGEPRPRRQQEREGKHRDGDGKRERCGRDGGNPTRHALDDRRARQQLTPA